jgi:TPR repeat protein
MVKRLLALPVLLLTLLVATLAFSADFQKGLDAANKGDFATAFKELKPLAEQGHGDAQYNLGVMYQKGNGVSQNYKVAVKWYTLAAEQGKIFAQTNLGGMYEYGQGVPKDYKVAVKWYTLAAEQGDGKAQFNLGWMDYRGLDGPKDYKTAVKWWKLSAEQGHAAAQNNLGLMHEKGWGVSQNYVRAHMWYNLAAAEGTNDAIENRGKVEKKMTSAQIAEAQRLVAKWQPKQVARTTQTPPKETANSLPTTPIDVQFRSAPLRPDDVAVVIGNANYKKQGTDIPNVTPAYADAAGIKRYFTQALGVREGNIIYLKDATGSQLTGVFGNRGNHKGKLFNWVKPNVSNVYVYYAGHGAPAGSDGSAFMVPSDVSAETIELTGYPLITLYKNLGKIPAKSITVILEACFSGVSQGGTVISNASPVYLKAKTPKIPPNVTVVSAGGANQMASWEKNKSHSLFTKYFLKGMSGEADAAPYGNNDGTVNYSELGMYLEGTMTYFARRYYGRDQKVQIVNGG